MGSPASCKNRHASPKRQLPVLRKARHMMRPCRASCTSSGIRAAMWSTLLAKNAWRQVTYPLAIITRKIHPSHSPIHVQR